ncbi:MAG: TIGR03663 family protein [Verrucomicrobia bacterium]|nr:TIGR03663 family protein [Verrucomicrobiota bacterium]
MLSTPSPKIRWAIFLTLALLALAVRLPQLGDRPMHTDEAVNGYITGQLLAGETFHYDPQDRHGPVLYLLAKPIALLCGAHNFAELNETELRLTPVIIGSAMILLFGAAVEMFGFIPCLVAALFFAFAPLPVYYSRYFIHETLFVAATFGLMLCGWRTLKTNSTWAAVATGLCAALMLACKETAVIHFFALAMAGFLGSAITRIIRVPTAKAVATGFGVFIVTTILLFTWGGRNWAALGDLAHAVPRFTARAAGEGHQKPFGYYFAVLDPLFIFSLVAIAGCYAAICDAVGRRRQSSLLIMFYGVATFVIYSTIPYKTPWLALNLWLPLALLCGLGMEAIWLLATNNTGRWFITVAFGALLLSMGQQTRTFVFDKPIDEKNPYAYAHTTEDLLRLPPRLEELAKARHLTQPRIAVVMADAWPLPWYLRKFSSVGFWQPNQETGTADFFITPSDVDGKLALQLKDYRPEFFGVRPNVLIILWRPELKEPSPPPVQP